MNILDELPDWAKWLARDEGGELWAYEYPPYKDWKSWFASGDICKVTMDSRMFDQIKWTDGEATSIVDLKFNKANSDSFDVETLSNPIDKYIADLTKELYAVQEQRLQLFLNTHPELSITDLYLKGEVANIEVQGTGEGDYMVTQVLPSIQVKPRTTTVTGEMSSQAVQDMLNLYGNNKVKITIEVE